MDLGNSYISTLTNSMVSEKRDMCENKSSPEQLRLK